MAAPLVSIAGEESVAEGGSEKRRWLGRLGIVGDIVEQDGDIFGDGVNIAARLESIAQPGGICVSARVQEDAASRTGYVFEDEAIWPEERTSWTAGSVLLAVAALGGDEATTLVFGGERLPTGLDPDCCR